MVLCLFATDRRRRTGLRMNEDIKEMAVFLHAGKLGLEGIVSKGRDPRYSSRRSPHWLKSKNPNAPAVNREAEEEWGRCGLPQWVGIGCTTLATDAKKNGRIG